MYAQALKIYGKLKDFAKVEDLWAEALGVCELNKFLVSARLAAAADKGDIEAAAAVLDLANASAWAGFQSFWFCKPLLGGMLQLTQHVSNSSAWLASTIGSVPLAAEFISSAIRSCWNSSKFSEKAARYFYDLHGKFGVTPDDVTFTTLAGALQSAPLDDVLWTYQEMKTRQITPDRVFAETFLLSVLGGDRLKWCTDSEAFAKANLCDKPRERLQAARKALDDFKSQRVELSGLCRAVGRALSTIGF